MDIFVSIPSTNASWFMTRPETRLEIFITDNKMPLDKASRFVSIEVSWSRSENPWERQKPTLLPFSTDSDLRNHNSPPSSHPNLVDAPNLYSNS